MDRVEAMSIGQNTEAIENLQAELDEIKATLNFIKDTIVKADTTITTVADQVMPTVNELMNSPMLKMLGVGKKK
jgi:prefoldin subunit 5